MTARTWLVFVGLGIVWGVPYLFIKLAVRELSPFDVAWGRITLAASVLAPLAWRRGTLAALRTHTAAVCAFAVLEFVLPYTLIATSEQWIPSSVAGIMIAVVPLVTAALGRPFGLHEPLGPLRLIIGLVLGIVGVATLVGFGTVRGTHGWTGVACMLTVTICYSAGPLVVQRHLRDVDSIGALASSLLIASGVLALPAAFTLPAQAPAMLAIASVAVLGTVCTALSMLVMFYLIKRAGAARTAVVAYINPAVATLLGVFVLHEHLGWSGPLGLVLILLSVALATRGAPHAPSPATESG